MKSGNLYHAMPSELPQEIADCLLQSGKLKIERIVSRGHCSEPGFWYDQEDSEWVLLLKGAARLRFQEGDRVVHLSPGMYLNIAPHEAHRVDWTSDSEDTIWLAVFY